MSITSKKRRCPTTSSPNESDDDNGEQPSTSTNQLSNKRRGSIAAEFAPPRLIVSERQQMAVLKQLTAGDESNTGSQSPSSITPQPRPSKINRRNEHGETIVHIAARKGDLKQIRKVLKAGANVNEADNAGWTPLHEAVTKNQFKAARLLLKSGANANAPGPEGQTPLVDAVLNNNTKMAELLLNYSADPSVVDITRLNDTMANVLKRETTVLESSDNENDDESISPLSPLTSDNDSEHDNKQDFHSTLMEQLDKDLAQRTTLSKIQRKKPYRRFRERSSQSSDSSSQSKTRATSGNNETSASAILGKNPYDFESEEEGEIRDLPTEVSEEHKKMPLRKQEHTKQRAHSGNSVPSSIESSTIKKRINKLYLIKEQEPQKFKSTSDDEQLQHIYRVPPLKIVLARAVLQKTPEIESSNLSNMNDDNNNLTIDSSSSPSLTLPIIEQNENFLSSMATNVPQISTEEPDEKLVISTEDNENTINENSPHPTMLDNNEKHLPLSPRSPSPTVIAYILDTVITQIESNNNNQLNSLAVIEDDQMDVEEDEEEEDENEDEEEEHEITEKNSSIKSNRIEKERISTKTSSTSKTELKPITRTLRSHARGRRNLSTLIQTSSSSNMNNGRRVSSRRRAMDNKTSVTINDREKRRKTTFERSKKEKDNQINTDDMQTSSNSDDQISENTNAEKTPLTTTTANANDEGSSCSSTGAGDESSTSSSTTNIKQSNSTTDIDSLPPNKRRLRERNVAISNTSNPSIMTDASTNSNSTTITDNSPTEPTTTREIPINSIKQFLEIRQQIDKRHETMLHEFVLPKVPKDFSETTMAKKSYLIAPSFSSYSNTTPSSIGIKRLMAPHDLDPHLMDVFTKQEDERYKMKIRHQVERDKLILSHEQEILRLYGNATRSSLNQDIPFSYCSLLKDNEVYNNPSIQLPEKLVSNDYTTTEIGKRGKHRWNGRSFIKWLEDSNLKYKRLSVRRRRKRFY
ncbi:hypothetical protein I4U23_009024 [Adineta vaga]|nr:hypothetical protein I4U23_009024 [Adineta vaga]